MNDRSAASSRGLSETQLHERVVAIILWLLALVMFAGAFPALTESQGVSALMLWPGAALLAWAGRGVWRGD